MPVKQQLITQRDIVVPPQFIVEGRTVATYGVTPTNPDFTQALTDAILVESSTPTTVDHKRAGDPDRQRRLLTRKNNVVVLRGKLQSADEDLMKWAMHKPNEAAGNNPDESRTFTQTYKDNGGTNQIQVWRGCKPQSCTLSVTADFTTLEITMSYLSYDDTLTLGTGGLDSTITDAPLLHSDVPAAGFAYNSRREEFKTLTLTVAYSEAMQDAAGSDDILFRKPSMRTISGSIEIFKQDDNLIDDALEQTPRLATLAIASATSFVFTGFVLDPTGEDIRGDSGDATISSYSFTCDSLTIT